MKTVFSVIPYILGLLEVAFGVFLFVAIAIKLYSNFLGKIKTVSATVIDKHVSKYNRLSRYSGAKKITDCSIIFLCDNKEKSFFTSKWMYSSVKKGDKGILKYRGSHFISFD